MIRLEKSLKNNLNIMLSLPWFINFALVFAYVGPGLGAGTIAAALGLIGSFFLALFALLFYPIKRLIRKFKNERQQ